MMTDDRCPIVITYEGHTFRCHLPAGHEGVHVNSEQTLCWPWPAA